MSVPVRLKHVARLKTAALDPSPRPLLALEHLQSGTGGLLPSAPGDPVPPMPSVADVAPGDVLFGKLRPYLAKTWVADRPVRASTELLCLHPMPDVDSRWLGYLVASAPFVDWAVATSDGAKMPRTSWERIGEYRVTVPPEPSQRAIADYLDRETARIDTLIAAHRRMASLLNERQQSSVSNVTHAAAVVSLDHIVPPGWSRISLRRCLSSSRYGIGESTEASGKYAVLGMRNVHAGEVVDEPSGFVSDVDETLFLIPGDLLFNRTNSRELVGKVGIVRALEQPTTFASYLVRLRTNDLVSTRYLNYLLNTREVLGLARSMALPSIGQANLNPSRYSAIVLPLPPVPEQERIISRLDAEAQRTGHASQRLGKQVELLRERRQALITAAVTGQLDIPEAA